MMILHCRAILEAALLLTMDMEATLPPPQPIAKLAPTKIEHVFSPASSSSLAVAKRTKKSWEHLAADVIPPEMIETICSATPSASAEKEVSSATSSDEVPFWEKLIHILENPQFMNALGIHILLKNLPVWETDIYDPFAKNLNTTINAFQKCLSKKE